MGQGTDGTFQVGQVFVDGGLQDRVGGVEVAVREVVAHAGDLPPRDGRLGGEQVIGECLDGFADFQQPDPGGAEYQAVGQVAACKWEWIASIAAWMSASRWWSR